MIFKKNERRPQKKLEDDLIFLLKNLRPQKNGRWPKKIGRRPKKKMKDDLKKMEYNPKKNGRQPKKIKNGRWL